MKKIFLGGTCGKQDWRGEFMHRLVARGVPEGDFFNPSLLPGVWNKTHQKKEDEVKKNAETVFFLLGTPVTDEVLPYSMYSLLQLVSSCFQAGMITKALLERPGIGDGIVTAFEKTLRDLKRIAPGVVSATWPEFVSEITSLWQASPKLIGFLGGTSGNNNWREILLSALEARGVDRTRFYDPMVKGPWNEDVQKPEDFIRALSTHQFFYLGDPKENRGTADQFSTYSAVEAYIAMYEDPRRAVVCFDHSNAHGHSKEVLAKFERDLRRQFPQAPILTGLQAGEDWLASRYGNQ